MWLSIKNINNSQQTKMGDELDDGEIWTIITCVLAAVCIILLIIYIYLFCRYMQVTDK